MMFHINVFVYLWGIWVTLSMSTYIVVTADCDELLPETNERFVPPLRPPLPLPRGHSLALSASSLSRDRTNAGLLGKFPQCGH